MKNETITGIKYDVLKLNDDMDDDIKDKIECQEEAGEKEL